MEDDAVLVEGELADGGISSIHGGGEEGGAFCLAEQLGLLHC